jgi:F420-0:gamma-glutamyl ligase-like protein
MDQTKISVKRNVLQQIRQDLVSNRGPQANKPYFRRFPRQMPGYCTKLGLGGFLTHRFEFIIHKFLPLEVTYRELTKMSLNGQMTEYILRCNRNKKSGKNLNYQQ